MKILIWLGCVVTQSIIMVLLGYAGIKLGGLPVAMLTFCTLMTAHSLSDSRDKKKNGTLSDKKSADSVTDPSTVQKPTSEFENDIRLLLENPDIQCRPDICRAEYAKAEGLLKESDDTSRQRAYDIMKNLAEQFTWPPACIWMGDYAAKEKHNTAEAAEWYRKAAVSDAASEQPSNVFTNEKNRR